MILSDAAWEHGIPKLVLMRIREIVAPVSEPTSLDSLDLEKYACLKNAKPQQWGEILRRYSEFQKLKRREGEQKNAHRTRLSLWLKEREQLRQELNGPGNVPSGAINASEAVGTYMYSREEVLNGESAKDITNFASLRVLHISVLGDKRQMMKK